MKNTLFLFGFSFIAILYSCEKTYEKIPESYLGKNLDNHLIGYWYKTYSTRDAQNAITIFTDTIQFRLNNSGSQTIYKFTEFENSFSFEYYTENNFVFIRPEGNEDAIPRNYHIRNDTLYFSGGIGYIKCINN